MFPSASRLSAVPGNISVPSVAGSKRLVSLPHPVKLVRLRGHVHIVVHVLKRHA